MDWTEIGKNNLRAAQRMLDFEPRSSASRAYYAAHAVLTEALTRAGCSLPPGRQTFPHARQAGLIRERLAARGETFVRRSRALVSRLYAYRIDADYRRTVSFNRSAALDAIRSASSLFVLLGVNE